MQMCQFVQFVMSRFRVKLVLNIFFLGSDDDSHEHESCTSLSHPDIYVIQMNVTFLSTMVLTWVCIVEMIDFRR